MPFHHYFELIRLSGKGHDFLAFAVSGAALAVAAAEFELWLKIVVLILTIIFLALGIAMRHRRLRGYVRPGELKADESDEG